MLPYCRGPEDDSWISTFQSYYKRFGKDIPVYQKVRRTWNRLEDYLKVNDPRMLDSLRGMTSLQNPNLNLFFSKIMYKDKDKDI